MSDISVGHEEANIACTVVLLQRAVEVGVIPQPLAVELSLGSPSGWRRAAIEHLDNTSKPKPTAKPPVDWQEFNEELDWEDRRALTK